MCAWPTPSAGQGRSGVLASQMWTCASTIVRRAGCALAGPHAGDASVRLAPAATVVVRTSRRDNMDGLLFRGLFGRCAWHAAGILAVLCRRRNNRPQLATRCGKHGPARSFTASGLVRRFHDSNYIDDTHQPCPEERAPELVEGCARLKGRPQARCPWPPFEMTTLRARSSRDEAEVWIRSFDMIGFMKL